MASKEQVLSEIRRIAGECGGSPPGKNRFESETGIREHEWLKFWARWGDALIEAGFKPNSRTAAIAEEKLLEKLVMLARELGRFPVGRELILKANRDPDFPSPGPFRRLGGQKVLMARLREHAFAKHYDDVVALCGEDQPPSPDGGATSDAKLITGFVYLMKSGRHYKIGRTVSVGSRERQLAIKIPVPPTTVHSIETDDPVGVEAYWHRRFESKRGEGEWFDLSPEDIKAFKRWKKIA
jgi:Meiotically up-regulated gene 113